ncbi:MULTISPECIES: tail fiber assembly protein [unclassified Serratia (in: enterobacteria)]|uniref:tail fiber assembly protein n=1 Tax=unclassified Serratia (in: enterobacteria) TaxID=2647522 RepID=UPI0004698D05|nr:MULTISPECIES: tail fiber assembly protein [unclassified Serratia (in: enterobacteria)]
MKHLKNLKQYNPDEPELGAMVAYLRDEDGNDWYEQQRDFLPDTTKIAYDADGTVWAVTCDVSMLWPVNLSVVEVSQKNTPAGLSDAGGWMFNGKKIIPRIYTQAEHEAQAQAQKEKLMTEASAKTQAWQTQLALGMITEGDKKSLIEWMEYVQKVQAIDVGLAPDIVFPDQPA